MKSKVEKVGLSNYAKSYFVSTNTIEIGYKLGFKHSIGMEISEDQESFLKNIPEFLL